ncbi:hypothetical protein [Paenalcaligenes suwonensis]|uniref:hypothetical protein n=1 Tax=Paenalcaligenes suwonensis TaxID=1202713 RepID=UPI0014094BAC|nr:hypothetical protein [Paenalcaligenes suwonensis]NHC61839.1 hypothetical protein [Paenalcaligenes suwonensis]
MKKLWRAGVVAVTITLSACYSTGNSYNSNTAWLEPGVTTVADARLGLGTAPTTVYPQTDGGSIQVWFSSQSIVPNAIYVERELWLEFGPNQVLRQILRRSTS